MTDNDFYAIAEGYLDATLRIHPSQATLNGYHKYDPAMEDLGRKGSGRPASDPLKTERNLGRNCTPRREEVTRRIQNAA